MKWVAIRDGAFSVVAYHLLDAHHLGAHPVFTLLSFRHQAKTLLFTTVLRKRMSFQMVFKVFSSLRTMFNGLFLTAGWGVLYCLVICCLMFWIVSIKKSK